MTGEEAKEMATEALLEALVTGDVSPEQPDVKARLEAEPELREAWLALQSAVGEVDDAYGDVRAAMQSDESVPALDVAAARRAAAPPRRLPWPALGLAAAVLIAGLIWMLQPAGDAPNPMMGAAKLTLSPAGEPSDYALLRWTPSREDLLDYYLVVISNPTTGAEIAREQTRETTWQPGASADDWPSPVHWAVIGYDVVGRQMARADAVIWRD